MFELRMYSCCCCFFLCMFVSGFSVRLFVCVCVCVCVCVFCWVFCVIVFFLLFIFDVVNCRYQKCCCLFRGFFRGFLKGFFKVFYVYSRSNTSSHRIDRFALYQQSQEKCLSIRLVP